MLGGLGPSSPETVKEKSGDVAVFLHLGSRTAVGYGSRIKVRGCMGEKSPKIGHIPPQFSATRAQPPNPGQISRKTIRSPRARAAQEPRATRTSPKTNATAGVSSEESVRTLFATYFATYPGNVPSHTQKGRSTGCESAYLLANPTGLDATNRASRANRCNAATENYSASPV